MHKMRKELLSLTGGPEIHNLCLTGGQEMYQRLFERTPHEFQHLVSQIRTLVFDGSSEVYINDYDISIHLRKENFTGSKSGIGPHLTVDIYVFNIKNGIAMNKHGQMLVKLSVVGVYPSVTIPRKGGGGKKKKTKTQKSLFDYDQFRKTMCDNAITYVKNRLQGLDGFEIVGIDSTYCHINSVHFLVKGEKEADRKAHVHGHILSLRSRATEICSLEGLCKDEVLKLDPYHAIRVLPDSLARELFIARRSDVPLTIHPKKRTATTKHGSQ